MGISPSDFLIDDETINDPRVRDLIFDPVIDGEKKARGGKPRDFKIDPPEMFAPPSEIVLIPRSEWSARIKEKEERKSRLSDIRNTANNGQPIPSTDQGQRGYCWGHSTTSAAILARAVAGLPYVRLSAYAPCCIIKNYRDEGGWCGLSAKFFRERGCPSTKTWPEKSTSRDNDNPQTWAEAAQYKVVEDWVDLTRDLYDQNLTFDMVMSLALSNVPGAVDFNHWGHSVGWADAVEVEANSFGLRIWNSWSDSWGDKGMGILRGSKAIPDGALAFRVVGPSITDTHEPSLAA